uniref:Uncharacterized protein n=1 Tax=Cacopsylla melanoneura TaxID=428564 RepID=A0A8D8YJM5_9HEMI
MCISSIFFVEVRYVLYILLTNLHVESDGHVADIVQIFRVYDFRIILVEYGFFEPKFWSYCIWLDGCSLDIGRSCFVQTLHKVCVDVLYVILAYVANESILLFKLHF